MNIKLKTTKSLKLKTAGKYCAEDILVEPTLEDINLTPTEESQEVLVSEGFSGIKKVNLSAIQTEKGIFNSSGTFTPSPGKYFKEIEINISDKPPVLQEKTAIPTKREQLIVPDEGYEGISRLHLAPIPEEYIIPEGILEITENDTYDVTNIKTVVANIEGKEDLTADLEAQNQALNELEETVNNLPDKGNTTEVKVSVVGVWTLDPNGGANTVNGVYYSFTPDGKIKLIALGNITEMGTYNIEGNKINISAEGEQLTWYYNEDDGIAVEENAESMMWRLVPEGTLESNENGEFDVTALTKFIVNVPDKEIKLQDKETTPTKETQVVTADEGFDGLNSNTVKSIPEEYIIPEGDLKITENNKQYDVTNKKTVTVSVPSSGGGSASGDLVEQNRQFAMAKDLRLYISDGKAFDENVYNDEQLQYIQDILNYIVRGETV